MNRFRSRRHRPTNTPRRIQAFRLEPLRTPSGLLDSSDDLSVPFIDALSDPIDPVELPDLDFDLAALDTPDPELVSPFNSGTFTVGETGTISVDYLFDGGGYQGELGFFSLDGLEDLEPGSEAFIQAAANRALSNSELGHLVIQDAKRRRPLQ
ncbi:MAG: hypothetical protein HC838_02820 [Spirulinaceae cyanobacterium RM2_2_10]|nr:hypothetical protein [Spirulinaceae cyanobacterium RM2_2_10]